MTAEGYSHHEPSPVDAHTLAQRPGRDFGETEVDQIVVIPAHRRRSSGFTEDQNCTSIVGRVLSVKGTPATDEISLVVCSGCSHMDNYRIDDLNTAHPITADFPLPAWMNS